MRMTIQSTNRTKGYLNCFVIFPGNDVFCMANVASVSVERCRSRHAALRAADRLTPMVCSFLSEVLRYLIRFNWLCCY